jgi:hypothetical protein
VRVTYLRTRPLLPHESISVERLLCLMLIASSVLGAPCRYMAPELLNDEP